MKDLRSFVETQLEIWEVPGCAVAAVKDADVVVSEGFGLRDLNAKLPVTDKTMFPIGSTTKAFTSAAVGTLVDRGLVEWERPVSDYIADFRMHDAVATERLTPRDLLSHFTGLPRHEFVWLGHPDRSLADLVSRLRYLPLSKDIRQEFQYSNHNYALAGHLVEVVSGTTWAEYVKTNLLKPLGMDHTNFSIDEMHRGEFSKPYERRDDRVVEIPFRAMGDVGAAGGINSNVSELVSWLRTNLFTAGSGEEVVAPDTLRYIQSAQALIPEASQFPEMNSYAYGLGWVVGQYRGRRHVHHNGGLDGFYTECMLIPEQNLGVFVLSNRLTIGLGRSVALRVIDELLELEPIDWSMRLKERVDAMEKGGKDARDAAVRVKGAALLRPPGEYEGDYEHPGYGKFSIETQEDRLVPRFGTLTLELKHRHFDVFDLEWHELSGEVAWPLTFLTGPDGDVGGLTIPFEGSVEPIQFDRLPDPVAQDPKVLETLTGSYEMGPIRLEVLLKGESTLTVSAAGAAPTELAAKRGLRFALKEAPGTTVEFVVSEGKVEKVIVQPGGVFTPAADA